MALAVCASLSHKGHSQSKISFSLMVNRMEARSRHFDIYYLCNKLKIEWQWLIHSALHGLEICSKKRPLQTPSNRMAQHIEKSMRMIISCGPVIMCTTFHKILYCTIQMQAHLNATYARWRMIVNSNVIISRHPLDDLLHLY